MPPSTDCPECDGTGYMTLRPGNSHEEPQYAPCTNVACYSTSDDVWCTWAVKGVFEFASDYDGWEMRDAVAVAMRDRYFDLRRKERRNRVQAVRAARGLPL